MLLATVGVGAVAFAHINSTREFKLSATKNGRIMREHIDGQIEEFVHSQKGFKVIENNRLGVKVDNRKGYELSEIWRDNVDKNIPKSKGDIKTVQDPKTELQTHNEIKKRNKL